MGLIVNVVPSRVSGQDSWTLLFGVVVVVVKDDRNTKTMRK